MPTVNQVLEDEQIAHAVSLEKYKVGVVRRIIALLNRSDADLSAALTAALERLPAESFTVERLELLLAEVRLINIEAYAAVAQELQDDLKELAGYEADWQQELYKRVLPEPVQVRFPIASVSAEQAYAAALARPFQGRLLKDWGKEIAADRMVKIRNAIRTGYLEGKTTDQIIRSIRGSRATGYADGFLERPRKDLAAVVRTAVSHTAATARLEFNNANEEILKADKWVSTLDNKTSPMCRIRDQLQYAINTHKPIGHKVPWLQGPGKIHWCCRSTSSAVTKSWKELGMNIDEMTPAQRASMDGQVPANTTYSEWLNRQSDARKLEVLGPERYQLFKSGKVELEDFYTPTGEWMTIKQLRAQDSALFRQPTGEFTVYDTGYPLSKPDISTPARKAAVEIEDKIRGDKLETGAFIGKDGSIILQRQGEPDSVGFPVSEFDRLKGSTFTHNHPGNGTFSEQDINLAAEIGVVELRAVGPTLRYVLSAPNGWPESATMESALAQARSAAIKRVNAMVHRGDLELQYSQAEAEHQVWVAYSDLLKLLYQREKS
ncbi:hypothetical protein [Pseudomonas sp. B1(2018)]|uniref:hypothetical protein n=1 Tax=Pseudomonas sp. B1(2018) TaxID=2233856 RepID=UPI002113CDD5|nr:hypothetical protein [Pseudomonas sp. B1(2018)]